MNELLFDTGSIGVLAGLILNLAVFGYMLTIRAKSAATWWLMTAYGASIVSGLIGFYQFSLYSVSTPPAWLEVLSGSTLLLQVWAYLQFAFHFLENPFPRETKGALLITTLLVLVNVGLTVFVSDGALAQLVPTRFTVVLGMCLWATLVFWRKWRRAVRHAPPGPTTQRVRAFRTFTLINGFLIAGLFTALIFAMLDFVFQMSIAGGLRSAAVDLMQFMFLGFGFGIVLAYLNYGPEPTSFQAKLVGLSLVGVLALVSVMKLVVPAFQSETYATKTPQQQGIRLTPDALAQGGYEARALTYQYDPDLGDNLQMSDDSAQVRMIGFDFPFYGEPWDRLYISPNGAITFGAPIYRDEEIVLNAGYFYNDLPKLAPLYTDLDPSAGGGVFFKQTEDHVTITWHEVPRFETDLLHSMQVVLYQSGIIDMVYKQVETPFWGSNMGHGFSVNAQWGLMPGETTRSGASFLEALPYTIAPGAARTEDFRLAYRQRAHQAMLPLIWLVLGASLFIIVVFPLVYRSSLVKPLERVLEGVRRVNAGELATEVRVGARDEIGRLTHHFNRMTQSLQRYNSQMEALVAERTHQLEQSLDELKTTQAQLIQAEKMASLGALTAGIAHEIKNPLNFINNFAEVNEELADELREAVAKGEDLSEIIDDLEQNASVIKQHGKRADAIVHAMMQHASGGIGQRTPTDLNALVSEHIDLAYHGKRAQVSELKVEIERDLAEEVGSVEVVPQEIGRVLLNLLGNAFDAVHAHALMVNGQFTPTVTVSTRQVESRVEIRVSDNGPGIPTDIRAKIFEPFFTTKPTGSGTGLGLSLSYDIVTQGHGGSLAVESKEGEGATFIVTLPVNQTEPSSSA